MVLKQLNRRQWLALPAAVVGLVVCYRRLQKQAFTHTWSELQQQEDTQSVSNLDEALDIAGELHESVRVAARLVPFKAECLPRSIVLQRLLLRRGIPAVVRLGVGKAALQLHSHAWVEIAGQPIAEKASVNDDFSVIGRAGSANQLDEGIYNSNHAARPNTEK